MEWLKRLFSPRPRERSGIPEVVGQITDADGRVQPLRRGPLRHDGLTAEQIQRVARLREVLAEAYPMTLEGWIDGFRRDAHPESEIAIIEAVASVYLQLVAGTHLTVDEKQRLYGVLCLISAGNESPELAAHVPLRSGLPEFSTLARMYREARQSGRRP